MPYLSDLYYQAYQVDDPERKVLVLIHGAGGDHMSWPTQLRRMSGYRVFTPDLPGHGKSRGHGLQRVSAFGEAVVHWLRALELPRVVLCGHSMGGAIALWIGVNYPELLHGLVLVSTGAVLPVNLSLVEELATQVGFPTAVDKIMSWSFHSQAEPAMVETIRRQMLKLRPSVLAGDFRACDDFDIRSELEKIQASTLILVGDEDKMTPRRFSEELTAGISTSKMEIVPRSGHMLPLERPGETARLVRKFLDKAYPV